MTPQPALPALTPEERAARLADLLRITWITMRDGQSRLATGTGRARRYTSGFSPLLGFADPAHPAFDDLLPFCAPGEHFYTDGWSGPAPAGWRVDVESTMFKMVWEGEAPAADAAPDAVRLDARHVDEAVALATLTKPGPFGPRTIELGEYWGIVEDGRLVAMAGERMVALPLREISGVCTHPGHQGRGLAKRLMLKLVHRQLARGERPFLHVMHDNAGARGLYERMGFRTWAESVVRVVSRVPDPPAATPTLTVTREDPGTPDALRLIDELSGTLEAITGASGRASSDPGSLRGEDACFLVARDASGAAVGCGGWRALDDVPQAVEVKRMYARPGTRGVGAAVLAALEREARARGAREAWLETRRVNTRAVAFYERHGYAVIPNYGRYVGRDDAVCLGKRLADGSPG